MTLDAGLMVEPVVRGAYLGPIKGHRPELSQAIEVWVRGGMGRPPDAQEGTRSTKDKGALAGGERCPWGLSGGRVWLARAQGRRRCRLSRLSEPGAWEAQEVRWAAGGPVGQPENRLHWVRDVSFCEDRLHGRKVGPGLSVIRNVALNLFGGLGYRFVVDGFRTLAARSDRGLSLLIHQIP